MYDTASGIHLQFLLQPYIQLNGKHLGVNLICYVTELMMKFAATNSSQQLFVLSVHRQTFLQRTLHYTQSIRYFHPYTLQFLVQISLLVRQKFFKNLQIKTEIFLTRKQLRKHRNVKLERLLYSFRCLVLRHCAG